MAPLAPPVFMSLDRETRESMETVPGTMDFLRRPLRPGRLLSRLKKKKKLEKKKETDCYFELKNTTITILYISTILGS